MINLLMGPPGGGKSYEATVYHVLAALEAGRKVITNLPLNLDELSKIVPRARVLVEIREKSRDPRCSYAFGSPLDYEDDWRDEKTGQGALFVVDECHKPLPRRGMSHAIPVDLPEEERARLSSVQYGQWLGAATDFWYAEHRHTGCDVLLMTQSHGKVSKAITDQIQVCYRVKKATVFGNSDGYIRKVQDGVRGEVLSVAERKYEPKWFPLYKSHTRVVGAVIEADARDVSPAFTKWKRSGYAVIGFAVVWLCVRVVAFMWSEQAPEPVASASARTKEHAAGRPKGAGAVAPQNVPQAVSGPPVLSADLRLVGVLEHGTKGYAITYSRRGEENRVPLYLCSRQPFEGWVCNLDGQLVTATTGESPPRATGSGLADRIIAPS